MATREYALRWTLGRKIGLGAAGMLALTAAAAVFSVLSHRSLLARLGAVAELDLPLSSLVARLDAGPADTVDAAQPLLAAASTAAEVEAAIRRFTGRSAEVKENLLEALRVAETGREAPGFLPIDRSLLRLQRDHQELEAAVAARSSAADPARAAAAVGGSLETVSSHVGELRAQLERFSRESVRTLEARASRYLALAAGLAAAALAVATTFTVMLIRGVGSRMRALAAEAGDAVLRIRNDEVPQERLVPRSSDEIGYLAFLLNDMIQALGENMTVRQQLIAEMESAAGTDRLTGGLSRRRFVDIMEAEIERAGRYKGAVCFVLLDVDGLATVNRLHGTESGDYVLATIANIVRHNVRRTDRFVRWTGGQLAVLVPETPLEGARYMAEKLRRNVEVHPFDTVGRVTVSCAVVQLGDAESRDALLARAEAALQKARDGGRNQVAAG